MISTNLVDEKRPLTARSIQHELRWVKVRDDRLDLRRFPDFMVIGPQRTGTTWLNRNLRRHPQIFLSSPKELYFFSSLKYREPPHFQSEELDWYLEFFRESFVSRARRSLNTLKHFGELYRPKVRGECTASYAAQDPDIISEITTLNPNVKAIMMIRNPVDRAWSEAKKYFIGKKKKELSETTFDEFKKFFNMPYQLRCAQFVANIDNWSVQLKPEHLFIGRFDDLSKTPETVLLNVMRFLGVRADPKYFLASYVHKAVNPSPEDAPIPGYIREYLLDLYRDELESLEERFGLRWF